jgi:hypothetical protein
MPIKIVTLNLCLGLCNKKEIVKNIIQDEKIDILCPQEKEIVINIDHNLMSFLGYLYESESNAIKSTVGCYVNSNLSYVRRLDLEGNDSHLVILDVKTIKELRIINIYRCFNPQNNINPLDFFRYQVDSIHSTFTNNTIFMGDLNLDWNKKT